MYAKWDNLVVSSSDEEEVASSGAPPPVHPSPSPHPSAHPSTAATLTGSTLERLTSAERLGEDILTDREQAADLERRRSANREALGAMRKLLYPRPSSTRLSRSEVSPSLAPPPQSLSPAISPSLAPPPQSLSPAISPSLAPPPSQWICLGDVFIKRPHGLAVRMLEEDETRLESEISEIHARIRRKTEQLAKVESTT